MSFSLNVSRGHTFQPGIPFTLDDLNAAALPAIELIGAVSWGDLGVGDATNLRPDAYAFAFESGAVAGEYVVDLFPAAVSREVGLQMSTQIGAGRSNLTTTPTLNVNLLGPVAIRRMGGLPLRPGDLRAGTIALFQLHATYWALINPLEPDMRQLDDDGSIPGALVMSSVLPMVALYQGARIAFESPVTATAGATLDVDGLGAKPIYTPDYEVTVAGFLQVGQRVELVYDESANLGAGAWIIDPTSDLPTALGAPFDMLRTNAAGTARENISPVALQTARASTNAVILIDKVRTPDNIAIHSSDTTYITSVRFTPKRADSKILIEFTGTVFAHVAVGDATDLYTGCWVGTPLETVEPDPPPDPPLTHSPLAAVSAGVVWKLKCATPVLRHVMDSWGLDERAIGVGMVAAEAGVSFYLNIVKRAASVNSNFADTLFSHLIVTELNPAVVVEA